MLQALIAGQRDPKALAQLARGKMRSKLAVLEEALTGHFDDHHGLLCRLMLERVDAVTATIDQVTAEIDRLISPFAHQVAQLDAITGVGVVAAQELIAEVGVEMVCFPSAAHLVSWAKFAPIDRQSAGTKKRGATGRGNPWLAATVGEIVAALASTDTFLGERYRRLVRRRGKHRAIVAVGNSVLTIVWHLLADPQARYQISGPTSTGPTSTSDAANVTSSANSSTSPARRSSSNPHPSNPPPDTQPTAPASSHHWTRLRCAAPGAAACPLTVGFSSQEPGPLRWAAVEAGKWVRARPGRRSYCDASRARESGWRWGPPTGTVDCCWSTRTRFFGPVVPPDGADVDTVIARAPGAGLGPHA
jgi:hypothetical protein